MPEIRKNSMASMLSLRSSFSQNDENSKRFSGGISHSSIDVSVHEKDSTKNHSSAIQRVNEETTVVNISPTKLKPMQHFSSRRKILRLFERRPANE